MKLQIYYSTIEFFFIVKYHKMIQGCLDLPVFKRYYDSFLISGKPKYEKLVKKWSYFSEDKDNFMM